jgi:flagellar hook-associated protein FlgK
LLAFREQVLAQAQGALNTLTQVVTNEVNEVHRSGLDAQGRLGGDLFAIRSDARSPAAGMVMVVQDANRVAAAGQFRVINNPLNTGSAQARVQYQTAEFLGPTELAGGLAGARAPQIGFERLSLSDTQPVASVGLVPVGSRDLTIAMTAAQPGQVLQVMTRDGRHLIGQALTGQEKSLVMLPGQGMEAGASYNASGINADAGSTYMGMDIFFGARGAPRENQRFDSTNGAVLPPELAPAQLVGAPVGPSLQGPLAAGTFTLNGVDMPALNQSGALTVDDVVSWLNQASASTGVLASAEGGALVLNLDPNRPNAQITDEIRLGLGDNGQPSDLAKLGLTPALHVRGAAPDDLLVFVTNRSGSPTKVDLSSQFVGWGGDVKQTLRASPLQVKFTSATAYQIFDTRSETVLAERAFDPSNPNATISYRGLALSFSTAPREGDTFTIDGNSDGIGNNEAMLTMVALENKPVMPGGLTMTEVYIERVSQVGNVARQAAISQQALTVVYEQAREARDGVSGVSLDQEAAELVRFQQAYQANAKVMQIASQLFDSILQVR